MNAWNNNPKKNNLFMEQNREREAINLTSGSTQGRNGYRSAPQRQQGSPTRLRYRTEEVEVQWLD